MDSSTIPSPFVVKMLEGARDQGYNLDRILADCGIAPSVLEEKRSRITFRQLSDLSLALMELMDDESYGLLDRPSRCGSFKHACYSALNGSTVERAMGLLAEFSNLMDLGLVFQVVAGRDTRQYRLIRRPGARIRNSYAIEHILLNHHRTLCWMADEPIPVLRVDLDYPAPEYADAYRPMFYNAPVHFGQKYVALTFSESSMTLPVVKNLKQLNQFLQAMPLTLLSQAIAARTLSAQLRAWLERRLRETQTMPSIDEAAQQFDLHPQTFRRSLKKEGLTFQAIKMQIRRDLAVDYLNTRSDSIETIAQTLDFSETSAFIRAFKSWTGFTPLAFRKLC